MSEKLIICDNLGLKRGKKPVLRHLNAEFRARECHCIYGPSGSGKTILLECIAGSTSCDEGGVDRAGEIPEYVPMLPELPSRVTVHSYLRRMASGSQREEITEAVIHFFNFEDVLQERAGRLSPGWQKRLQLAKLFFSEKKVWLLDHPAALLDTEGQHMLEGLISTRREQGGLILYTLPADDIPPHEGEVPDGIHYLNLADFKASDS